MLLTALALRQKVELVGSKANILSRATISHCLAELRNRMRLFLTRSFLPCVCTCVRTQRCGGYGGASFLLGLGGLWGVQVRACQEGVKGAANILAVFVALLCTRHCAGWLVCILFLNNETGIALHRLKMRILSLRVAKFLPKAM